MEGERKKRKTQTIDVVRFPTLGQVAENTRFKRVATLIEPVQDTPVNELSKELRDVLLEGEEKPMRLVLITFFGACDKLAHVASEDESPGKKLLGLS